MNASARLRLRRALSTARERGYAIAPRERTASSILPRDTDEIAADRFAFSPSRSCHPLVRDRSPGPGPRPHRRGQGDHGPGARRAHEVPGLRPHAGPRHGVARDPAGGRVPRQPPLRRRGRAHGAPEPGGKSYFQLFPLEVVTPLEGTSLSITVERDGAKQVIPCALGTDFTLFPRGVAPGEVEAPVVFVGQGRRHRRRR